MSSTTAIVRNTSFADISAISADNAIRDRISIFSVEPESTGNDKGDESGIFLSTQKPRSQIQSQLVTRAAAMDGGRPGREGRCGWPRAPTRS